MALSREEIALITRHEQRLAATASNDELLERYYRGSQRLQQLGMAIPPEMRQFLVIANWPRVVVDTINARQQMRSMMLPGESEPNADLRRILDVNGFASRLSMFNLCRMIYGRGILTVGANEADSGVPFVRAESPRQVDAIVDTRTEQVTSAARFYGDDDDDEVAKKPVDKASTSALSTAKHCTLYLPDVTVWADRDGNRWVEVERDEHQLGAVPVVVHLNRRMPGNLAGESQMTDVIPLADAAARSLTNMQFAQEAHGIPRMWMTGVARQDFMDKDGNPVPQFEAYFDAIHTLASKDARVGQLDAADLKNFQTAMEIYGVQASIVTGFPARLFGLHPANPPAEGAIHADESGLNRSVEQQNEDVGVTLGKVGALLWRFARGEWPADRTVAVDWFDPATPTVSQREDALAKRRASGVLSREGYWDELGWPEPRKAKEREYLRREVLDQMDPYLERLSEKDAAGVAADSAPVD